MRRARGVPFVVVVLLALAGVTPTDAAGETLALDPNQGPAGSSVKAEGAGFPAKAVIDIFWDKVGTEPIAKGVEAPAGSFVTEIVIPAGGDGPHFVIACTTDLLVCADADFTITTPTLPPATPSPTPAATPIPTVKSTPSPTSKPTPAITASPGAASPTPPPSAGPVGTPPPFAGSIFVDSEPDIGTIGAGILGGPAIIQIPGVPPEPEGYQPRCEPPPQATIVDFDDHPAGTDLRESYAPLGVHLEPGTRRDDREFLARDEPLLPWDASTIGSITMPNAVRIANDPEAGAGEKEALHIRFDSPQRLIGIHVGGPSRNRVSLDVPGAAGTGVLPDPYRDLTSWVVPSTISICMMVILPAGESTSEIVVSTTYDDADLYVDRLFFSDDPRYVFPPVVSGFVTMTSPFRGTEVDVALPITLTGYAIWHPGPGDTTVRTFDHVLITYVNDLGRTINRYAEVILPVAPSRQTEWRLEGVGVAPGPIRISLFASGPGVVARSTSEFTGYTLEERRREAEGTFDLQPIGIEVTQGIRGLVLPMDPGTITREGTVHVAGKATTARLFGRVVWGPDGPPSRVSTVPTDAWLLGFSHGRLLPGSPLRARQPIVDLEAVDDVATGFQTLRGQGWRTWNFDLPLSWTQAGSIDLLAWVNPPGSTSWREGGPDAGRNDVWLQGIRFEPIDPRDVIVYATDFYWRRDGPAQHAQPTLGEIVGAMDYWERAFPIPYGGLDIVEFHVLRIAQRPCDGETLVDPVADKCSAPAVEGVPVWDNAVIIAEQAERITHPGELFIPTIFSPSSPIGCTGQAGIGSTPLFHAGACGPTMAQEAAHSLGLIHLSMAHSEQLPARNRYPSDDGGLEPWAVGWDVTRARAILPGSARPHMHDFMSYGGGARWVSLDTWNRVAAALKANNLTSPTTGPPIRAGVGPVSPGAVVLVADGASSTSSILVSGQLAADGSVGGLGLISVEGPAVDLGPEGDVEVLLLAANGSELFRRSVAVIVPTHGGSPSEFHAFVPALDGAATVEVRPLGATAVRVPVSDAMSLADVQAQEREDLGLVPLIRSPIPVGLVSPRGSLRFDADVPGAPGDLTHEWLLDGVEVGEGASIFLANLTLGPHTLELRVAGGGRTGESSTTFVVDEDRDGDGLGDAWELSVGLDPDDPTDATSDRDNDGLPAWLEQSIGGDPAKLDTDGDDYGDDVEYAAGSDVADPNSLPMAIHGREGEPIPRLGGRAGDDNPPWIAILVVGVLVAGGLALMVIGRRRVGTTSSGDPAGGTRT